MTYQKMDLLLLLLIAQGASPWSGVINFSSNFISFSLSLKRVRYCPHTGREAVKYALFEIKDTFTYQPLNHWDGI